MKVTIWIFVCFFAIGHLRAQADGTGSISGFVYDEKTGEALIGANVFIEGTQRGSSTNAQGFYSIPRIPPGDYQLIVRYVGYTAQTQNLAIHADNDVSLDLHLVPEAIAVKELVVTAEKRVAEKMFARPVSKIELSAREINKIPQIAEADLLRSLQTLPGILPISDFSSALYVRGGTPDQNLYMIDGTDVYNPEHAFGLFSTFNTDAIKHVDLSKGGFGAEFGGRLSSVLNVTHLDGNRKEFEGSAAISLLSAKTTLQMPLGNFGSLSGSIRRTYFDKTAAKWIDEIPDYYFYDGNLKAFIDLNKSNKLTLSYYGGLDDLKITFNEKASEQTGFTYDWGNKTGSVRWTHIFTPQIFSNFWITRSEFISNFDLPEFQLQEENDIYDTTVKGDLEYFHSNWLKTKFGFEHKQLHLVYRQPWPDGRIDLNNRQTQNSGFLSTSWNPSPLWDFEAGLRVNHFKSDTSYMKFAPRASAKYKLTETSSMKVAYGKYYQFLNRIPRFFVVDIWMTADKNNDVPESTHYILGYQKEIAQDYQFEVETFYKDYQNILLFNHNFVTALEPNEYDQNGDPVYRGANDLFYSGDGASAGFEVMVRKDYGMVTGWVGTSIARTEYTFDAINQARTFIPRHDRTTTVNLVSNIDLKNALRKMRGKDLTGKRENWELSINFVYSSGQPFTEPGSGYLTGNYLNGPNQSVNYAPTKINNVRFPAYSRLDLSLTWNKRFKSWAMAPYLQVFNLGARKNVWFVNYTYENGIPDVEEVYMFPLLPTFGVNFTF